MPLTIDDLKISAKLPDLQSEMPVFTVRSASLDERRAAIEMLGDRLDLGNLAAFEVKDSLHFCSKAGEVQFYRPSGALWARHAAADESYDNEVRPWKGLERVEDKDGVQTWVLSDSASGALVEQSRAIMDRAGLLSEHVSLAGVELDQVAQLDAEGKQIGHYAGEATVRYQYRLKEIAVAGAGAKSCFYFNPGDRGPALVGAFHAWREIVDARSVRVHAPEAALDLALTADPELSAYHEQGYRIDLTDLDLVYYTLPAFAYQTLVFPALRAKGRALGKGERGEQGFEFARFLHVVSAEDYARADLFADYLAKQL